MSTENVTVIGLQWGDEGKGKIVDALAGKCKYVVRFCGGANAGHTVVANGQSYAFHLIPSGILRPDVINVIGNGVAFDPVVAMGEIQALRDRGIEIGPGNFRISSSAHLVMPYHRLADTLNESKLGKAKIGTTGRGIGPCYAEKASRSSAIRACDLKDPETLTAKIKQVVAERNALLGALHNAEPMDADAMAAEFVALGEQLGPMICNTNALLGRAMAAGEKILFEGGQGSMLDIDHGTFPFVTSSAVTACGVPTGAGVSPKSVGRVVGLVKAYTSRVGAGPFPSEQENEIGEYLRERGHEYGTTTGRPRRCGWLDTFALRYAADLSGVDEITISLLDVLSGMDEIKICTGYKVDGVLAEDFSADLMDRAECVYETLPGWTEDITDCRKFDELPENAKKYVARVEELVGRPAGFVSVGPDREASLFNGSGLGELV